MDSKNILPVIGTCDFDIAWDTNEQSLNSAIRDFVKAAGAKYESLTIDILAVEGPAGWPLVQFIGPQDDLDRLIKFYNADLI